MKLYTYCKSCSEPSGIRSSANTRSELERELGETFLFNCTHCGINDTKHVNDVNAKPSLWIALGGLAVSAIVTIALWKGLGGIGAISIVLPMMIWKQQNKSVHAFNRYRL